MEHHMTWPRCDLCQSCNRHQRKEGGGGVYVALYASLLFSMASLHVLLHPSPPTLYIHACMHTYTHISSVCLSQGHALRCGIKSAYILPPSWAASL